MNAATVSGRSSFLALFISLLGGDSLAQPVAGKSQPDRLDFGMVSHSATVEGSVRIFADGNDTAGIRLITAPPDFARIKDVQLGTQTFGGLGTRVVCDVSISIDTNQLGEHDGALLVGFGEIRTSVPVTVQVLPTDDSASRVLVVHTPFEKFSTDDASLFRPWLALVESANIAAHYFHAERGHPVVRSQDLSEFDVVLLGEVGVVYLTDEDVTKLKAFVDNGGQLVVTANKFYRGTVAKANELLSMAGLQMTDAEPRGEKSFTLRGEQIIDHPLTSGVRTVRCYRPSPIAVTDESKAKLLVAAPPYPGQGFAAVGQHGKGTVVAIGQSLWWNWIGSEKYKDSDNQLLLRNMLARRAAED